MPRFEKALQVSAPTGDLTLRGGIAGATEVKVEEMTRVCTFPDMAVQQRAAACREAFLYVHEQNERALAVYTAAGYRPDGTIRTPDFRGTRLRDLRLVKQL